MTGKKESKLLVLLILFCLLLFLSQSVELGKEQMEYRRARIEYEHWTDDTTEKAGGEVTVDFAKLQKKNPDIVAWIVIPETNINYPVVQGKDNSYYLYHTAAKTENHAGSIFLDVSCDSTFSSGNYILYGHNMKNKSMFGSLRTLYDPIYNEKASRQNYPDIFIETPREKIIYHVFSARRIHLGREENPYLIHFQNDMERRDYVKKACVRSLFPDSKNLEKEVTGELLTLSTCSTDGEDSRLIVQAYARKRIPR